MSVDAGVPLVKMANDIGDFFRAQPREEAIEGIAGHIKSYWTKRMREKLNAHLLAGDAALDELPRAAIERLNAHPAAKPAQPPGGDAG